MPPPRSAATGLWADQDIGIWRAVDVFRGLTLVYAVAQFVPVRHAYAHPVGAWAVLGAMALWTGVLAWRPPRSTWMLLLDLGLTCLAVLSTVVVDTPDRIAAGKATLPASWAAATVISMAVGRGWRWGLAAAVAVGSSDLLEIWPHVWANTIDSMVELILVGGVVGYTAELYAAGRRDLAQVVAVRSANRERERLAADIHDSVLQVLAYVQRRGGEIGGEAATLGRMAGAQEVRLRSLVAATAHQLAAEDTDHVDIRRSLTELAGARVTVAGPAAVVPLPRDMADAVLGAVRAALDNVARHGGARAHAWILVEDEADVVTVTVRDDGPGFGPGRLEQAAAEGRFGVVASIQGRITEVGGHVKIMAAPGEGTEVELRVHRAARA